jgi:CelD/BcsL family acetyltransferase involved in cellulose biosynthesis
LNWNPIFVLPQWLEVWWQKLGSGGELYLGAVRQDREIIGIAPLLLKGKVASIIGSIDVCDYLDFIIVPGKEREFFTVLLDELRARGVSRLDLRLLHPKSTVLTHLAGIARGLGAEVVCQKEDISYELDLPADWEGYFPLLTTKQRHEVRRKLRRLLEAGKVDYRCPIVKEDIHNLMDTFLRLFTLSRKEKAGFMSKEMEDFFRTLAETTAQAGLLRIGILELEAKPVAITMGFDYNNTVYLYNSAYDPEYQSLSVGVLSKVLCIKESIQEGKKKFDFLKGNEVYKQHLGGKEVPLYSCLITVR